jgi:hypothetical protein
VSVDVGVRRERRAAAVQDEAGDQLVAVALQELEQHLFVISAQRDHLVVALQFEHALDDLPRMRSAIDVVAEEDDRRPCPQREPRQ